MFGHINPTGDNSGGVQTTGPAESQGRYPQLFVTSPNHGPGIQIKTKGSNYSPRTVIGDGLFDNGIGITSAGTGPDITQEFFAGTGYNFTNRALISYHHKITNITNTGVTGPVFSITTFTNSGSFVFPNNIVEKTLIQTTNSNRVLELMSSGKGGDNQVRIGASGGSLITVWGPSGSPTGGVSIGVDSSNSSFYFPTTGALTGTSFTSTGVGIGANNRSNHSLVVTGVQTIGTNNPVSLFYNPLTTFGQPDLSRHSLLKISRNLSDSTTTVFPKGVFPAGNYPNSYPNGLEITSFIPSLPKGAKGSRSSVSISVGASSTIRNTDGSLPTASATGFFVSDTGENMSVGQYIDSTAAIGVSGASGDLAIRAKGGVQVTGNVGIVGNVSITGSFVDITGLINNPGGSLTNTITVTPIFVLPNFDGSISSGTFSYSSNGTTLGTYQRIGNIVHVTCTKVYGSGSAVFTVPLQSAGGIGNVVGHGINNTIAGGIVEVKKAGVPTSNQVEVVGGIAPSLGDPITGGTSRISFSYRLQ
jgi:hypothetical protein